MKTTKNDGKKRIGIVGSVVNGRSGEDWFGQYTGCDTVKRQIGSSGDIEVYINSPGGSVFAGFEILNALTAAVAAGRKVDIYISAMAASIASYISTGVVGATVYAAPNSKIMFHAPWSCACGSKNEIRDMADLLEKMEGDLKDAIESRGVEFEDDWFAAARMKWFNAKEALAAKLVDGIKLPPSELIAAISEQTTGSSWGDDEWDKAEKKDKKAQFDFGKDHFTKIAAAMEFVGFIKELCEEHYGEGEIKNVVNLTANSFEVILNDNKKLLLNYEKDAVNIVNIKWEPAGSQKTMENTMSTLTKTPEEIVAEAEAKVKAAQDALEAAEAKVKAAEALAEEAEAKAKASKTLAEEAEAKAKAIEAKAKAESITVIKAVKENPFTDEELDALDLNTIEKIALLIKNVDTDDKTAQNSQADNSIVSTPTNKSEQEDSGTLPPPKF